MRVNVLETLLSLVGEVNEEMLGTKFGVLCGFIVYLFAYIFYSHCLTVHGFSSEMVKSFMNGMDGNFYLSIFDIYWPMVVINSIILSA